MMVTPPADDIATGDATGLPLPADAAALLAAGPDFLTRAFRAYGSLPRDNHVVRICAAEPFRGGNSGGKMRLLVDYASPHPRLHRRLFVKFSRDLTDAFRDRRRAELGAEVRLAALSRHPAFPVAVPKAYFGDFHSASATGLLITEEVAFGVGAIEPLHRKCMDHELADPLPHYRATVTALARLAAAQKAGRLSPEVDRLFPFHRAVAEAELALPWSEEDLLVRVERWGEFAARCPQLLPSNVAAPGFIDRFRRDAVAFLRHQAAVRRRLYADPDHVALSHWNTHIDNAWFWRGADEVLHCGLLDWGMARQMNLALALWGGLSGGDLTLWEHRDALLALFAAELARHGGPSIDVAGLSLDLDLATAMLGLSLMMDVPALVLDRLPAATRATGLRDRMFEQHEVERGFLHVAGIFLSLWQSRDFGAALARVVEPAERR